MYHPGLNKIKNYLTTVLQNSSNNTWWIYILGDNREIGWNVGKQVLEFTFCIIKEQFFNNIVPILVIGYLIERVLAELKYSVF